MKVWLVGVSDCEGNSIEAVCATKEIAERELFKARDRLVKEFQRMDISMQKTNDEYCAKENKPTWIDNMYKDMITALSGNDYEKWDNFPHECPYLQETEVIEL